MSAAHKTLPLPAYVRVTNLQNGRSVVVRVNDRGPFVGNRIIDLSYTAASKLDMLRAGTAMVEVRSLNGAPPPVPAPASASEAPITAANSAPAAAPLTASPLQATSPAVALASAPVEHVAVPAALFIQAGAFSDPKNAERLVEKLRGGGYGKIFVRDNEIAGRRMYRVRIGPVPNVAEFDHIVAALERVGVHDAHLALD
jgi:rare lipoprotein A